MNYIEYLKDGKSIHKNFSIERTFSQGLIPNGWEDTYRIGYDIEAINQYVKDFAANIKKIFTPNNQNAPAYTAINKNGDIIDQFGNTIGHFDESNYLATVSGPSSNVLVSK